MPWRRPPADTGPIRLDPASPYDHGPAYDPAAPSAIDLEFDDGSWRDLDARPRSLDPPPLSFR